MHLGPTVDDCPQVPLDLGQLDARGEGNGDPPVLVAGRSPGHSPEEVGQIRDKLRRNHRANGQPVTVRRR
jgi:hypothetical protein